MTETAMKMLEFVAAKFEFTAIQIIEHYAKWHVASAITWTSIGIFAVIWAFKFKTPKALETDSPTVYFSRVALGAIGLLLIGVNLPDLFSPEGVAINHLLMNFKVK